MTRFLLLALALVAGAASAQTPADLPPASERGSVLLRGGTVHPVSGPAMPNTDVLVVDGVITRIGTGLDAPRGTTVIDVTGRHVTPGIIDAHSHIALSSVNEASNPIVAEVQMRDAVDPSDIGIYRALAGGVTSIHVMHGSANPVGGENETLKLRWGTADPDGLLFEGAPRTIKFALGENPTRVHGRGRGIRPSTRMGIEQVYREAFTEARAYRARQTAAAAARQPLPPIDRRMETLADILDGEVLVHCHSYRADEILMLMDVFRDFGIERLTFQHANEAFKVAPELAAFGAGASVFSDWANYKMEVAYSSAYNATILTQNGVRTSVNSDDAGLLRYLYHEAAKTQRYGGLSDQEALALVTLNPAWQLGIDDRVGTIEVGKDGDLAVFSASPLSVYARVDLTFVDGVARFDRMRDGDDQRLYVDPEEEIDALPTQSDAHSASCMLGTDLFGLMSEE
ncbi:amidohydrolase family protein [Rubrivirga sp. IMCC45206]|uniref:amidohydrolase family protein n=1 Tax=Rubrivirga sp. IMCC45206 TaxID=3391614 RepID=UPI003990384C